MPCGIKLQRMGAKQKTMGILTDDMKRVIEEQRLGFVVTVCDDGTPNLSPKGTMVVLDDDNIMFGEIRSPITVHNIQANPAMEINVVDPQIVMSETSEYRSRIIRAVKSRDTKPEMTVRRMVHAMGFRYRLHRKDLPGKPDLVFSSRKKTRG